MSREPNRDQSPKRYRFFVPKTHCRKCNGRILKGMGFGVLGNDLCCCCSGQCKHYPHNCRQCQQTCCMYLSISHMYEHDQLCCRCFSANDDSQETCVCCFNISLKTKRWTLTFLAQALGCDVPILESIWHNWQQKWHRFVGNLVFHQNVSGLRQLRRLVADNTPKGNILNNCLTLRDLNQLHSQLDEDGLRYVIRRQLELLVDYLQQNVNAKWDCRFNSFSFSLSRRKLNELSIFLKQFDPELNKEMIPKIADYLIEY